jgi:hypothetical protein
MSVLTYWGYAIAWKIIRWLPEASAYKLADRVADFIFKKNGKPRSPPDGRQIPLVFIRLNPLSKLTKLLISLKAPCLRDRDAHSRTIELHLAIKRVHELR